MNGSITTVLALAAWTSVARAEPTGVPPDETASASAADLAAAADATAEVAARSVAEPAPTPAQTLADDIDLAALGLDASAPAFDDKLNIYGFADVGWSLQHWDKAVPTVAKDTRAFAVGNFNIYLAKNLTEKARGLAEVRFTFLPNGSVNPDGTTVDTNAQDLTNFVRTAQWGGVVIERAYVEYDVTEHVTVRVGHWLTPYGIWNIDHGSPTIPGVIRPYIIGEQFFPEHQTGLVVFGDVYRDGFTLGYHLTASNGRGSAEAQTDLDLNVALGANATITTPWGLKLGGSYYRGRFTGFPAMVGGLAPTFREASYGFDAQYDRGALHAQVEVIARERAFDDGKRAAMAGGFTPDLRDVGYYGLAGYRFAALWQVMPFVAYERYKPGERSVFEGIRSYSAGLNFRPTGGLVLKLQLNRAAFDDGDELLAGRNISYCAAQASWVF